jgi:hypothetical protein
LLGQATPESACFGDARSAEVQLRSGQVGKSLGKSFPLVEAVSLSRKLGSPVI